MTIESDNANKLSLKRKFEQRIPSENQRFSGTSTLKKIEVFPRKSKPKSIALSGGIK